MKLTIPEMLDIAIDFLEKNLETDEYIFLCLIDYDLGYHDGWDYDEYIFLCLIDYDLGYHDGWDDDEWRALMKENKHIAEEKYAGQYWMFGNVWWDIVDAHLDGKLREVYELKLAFLKHLKNDLK